MVDLAKILVRRWKALVTIFALVVAASLIYVLLLPRSYQYVSVYNVAENAPSEALESPSSLVAKVRNLYLGPHIRKLLEDQGWEYLPFEVQVNQPSDTFLIMLASEASPNHASQVETLHAQVLESLQQSQQALVEHRRESLERQLESSREALEAVRGTDSSNTGELIATYTSRIADLEASLSELRNGEASQIALQSLEPVGTSRSLILALGIVLGGMLAVIGVFVLEFASLVCASLKDETTNGTL
ncbi:lipopolysaccharide biosynthesis protein [Halomonas denitrificans]|uniref:lipopolysaccharide biosynthesis protein n=1 Tax=Halomonas denitrificans TaxID=370769 RepID=UPI001FED2458|nr:lipopolysaccharide biosynthesis protein [Halomonas denitrificans]